MPPIDRRGFIRQITAGSGVLASGLLAGCDNDDNNNNSGITFEFTHGIASGDPLTDRVIIWTRVLPSEGTSANVSWEVATDGDFANVITNGETSTDITRDYTVKIDATGLLSGTDYFYRFKAGETQSTVGATRTLPEGAVDSVKLAVFSCSNYPAGYFHVYAEAAKQNQLDAAIHLGDYIYEYGAGADQYASADAESLGRISVPANELLSIDDYRQRYAQYRSDKDLQAFHAKVPFICVWDDHEVANDTYEEGAENHDPDTEGDFFERRAVALKARSEWLPVREQDSTNPLLSYRSFDFGTLLSLHMLDTRLIGRDQQLDYANYIDPTNGAFNAADFSTDMADTDRELLGEAQRSWLQGQIGASNATWQVLGQQILMAQMHLPLPLLTPDPQNPAVSFPEYGEIAIAFGTYEAISAQLIAGSMEVTPENLIAAGMTADQLAIVNAPTKQQIIAAPSIPYNLDAWDGYAVARETIYGTARALDKNLLVLSGDTHNAWASDLQDLEGNAIGVEFAGTSVSSPGLEEYLSDLSAAELSAGVTQLIPTLAYADTSRRGYMLVTVTPQEARADWYFVSTVKSRDYSVTLDKSLKTLPGAENRKLVEV